MLEKSKRGYEIRRGVVYLTWDAVDLEGATLRLEAILSKTKHPRVVPLQPATVAFLRTIKNRVGTVIHGNWTKDWTKWREEHGWKGKPQKGEKDSTYIRDGLRHAHGNYRMAMIRDIARVAEEMGNSPDVIRSHYDGAVPPAEAEKFWALRS